MTALRGCTPELQLDIMIPSKEKGNDEMTKYAVTCQSSTGTFELEVEARSHHHALDRAQLFIETHDWDGYPVRAHRAW